MAAVPQPVAGPLITAGDRSGECWAKIRQFYEQRLESLRRANENPKLTLEQTNVLRGRIQECRAILKLDKELPPHEPDNPPDAA